MKALGRLTLLDLGLIAALILTGVLWYLSSSSDGDRGSLQNVDPIAWEGALESLTNALLTGNLQASKSALLVAADVAAPANDGAAVGIRTFADALAGVDWTAADTAFGQVEAPAYQSPLFEQLYYTTLLALFFPDFPVGQPAAGAEWTQANLIHADRPTLQYWGTATWSLPTGIAESAGEADIAMPDMEFSGKLMLADDGEAMQLSLVFLGPLADLPIVDVLGFWTVDGSDESVLFGTVSTAGPGAVVMSLAAESRADNTELLSNADEIGVTLYFGNGQRLILRVEVGDTGRSVMATGLAR